MAQDNWRWCYECEGLCFAGNARVTGPSIGRCYFSHPVMDHGYYHRVQGSGLYVLHREEEGPGQTGWRWCHKCEGLWFSGNRVGGRCFADGGEHSQDGSWRYVVPLEGQVEGQQGWRFCRNCQGLWFKLHVHPNGPGGRCPAGLHHDETGSEPYVLEALPRELAWLDASSGPSGPDGVSEWFDRRSTTSEPQGAKASTSDSGWWPRFSNPGRAGVEFGDNLGSARKGLPIDVAPAILQSPYTAVVVVQRTSARGANYPLASVGLDCNLFGCAEDSVLHLGWESDRKIRFGQWADDVDLDAVPAFHSGSEVVSIISAVNDGRRKIVALDEPGFSQVSTPRLDGRLLRGGGRLISIGGPPRDMGWDFHFNGHVFEVILWSFGLAPRHLDLKRQALREKYSVNGVSMARTPN